MRIALCAPKGTGKTTTANKLSKHYKNCRVDSLAKPVKSIASIITNESIKAINSKKSMPWNYGMTYRDLLIEIGSTFGRGIIDDNLWVESLLHRNKGLDGVLIVDDVRFDNEAINFDLVIELRRSGVDYVGGDTESRISDELIDAVFFIDSPDWYKELTDFIDIYL